MITDIANVLQASDNGAVKSMSASASGVINSVAFTTSSIVIPVLWKAEKLFLFSFSAKTLWRILKIRFKFSRIFEFPT